MNAALLFPNYERFEVACELCTVMLAAVSHCDGYEVKRKRRKARLRAGVCVCVCIAWAATSTELRVHASEVQKQSKITSMGRLAINL